MDVMAKSIRGRPRSELILEGATAGPVLRIPAAGGASVAGRLTSSGGIAITGGGGNSKRRGPIDDTIKVWNDKPADQRNAADKDTLMQLFCKSEVLRLTNMRGAQAAKAGPTCSCCCPSPKAPAWRSCVGAGAPRSAGT